MKQRSLGEKFQKKRRVNRLLRALLKLNENFPKMVRLCRTNFQLQSFDRDYLKILKAVVYCRMKLAKGYAVNFIDRLACKLENKLFALREQLKHALLFELRQLQRNKNLKVEKLCLIIKKFSKVEGIAKAFLKKFESEVGDHFCVCRRDLNLLVDTLQFVKSHDRSLMRPETETYILELKAKLNNKRPGMSRN